MRCQTYKPYKPVPGSNRTEGTYEEVLAIQASTIPIGLPITYGKLDTGATQCRVIRHVIISFSKTPGLHHRLQMLPISSYHIFVMGYITQRSSPG